MISKETTENAVAIITIIFVVISISFVISFFILHINNYEEKGKQKLIQELCTRQQYDFCETKKVIYKLKEGRK